MRDSLELNVFGGVQSSLMKYDFSFLKRLDYSFGKKKFDGRLITRCGVVEDAAKGGGIFFLIRIQFSL